jgi:hypothetical protein
MMGARFASLLMLGPIVPVPAGLPLLVGLAFASGAPEDPAAGADPLREPFRALFEGRPAEIDPRAAGIGEQLPDLGFTDVEGRPGRLSDDPGRNALVVAVRRIGCPVAEDSGPLLAELEREFAGRGVDFLFLCLDPELDLAAVREREIEGLGFAGSYVHDPDQRLGRALGVEATGACFVIDSSRTLRYRGAVEQRAGTLRHELLRKALEAVLAGESVPVPATRAPGAALDIAREAPPTPPDQVTYHGEIARLLQRNCVECHHRNGPAPFSLETYAEVYDRRRMIGQVVEARIMPPWFADESCGPWKNDRRLSQAELDTLLGWIEAGAPEGDRADAPRPLHWPKGWLIGRPDEVFAFAAPRALPAEGVIQWEHVEAEHVVPRDLWVSRLQVLPSNPRVVHHASAEVLTPAPVPERPVAEEVMRVLTPWTRRPARAPIERWQYIDGFLPGKSPRVYEEGVARFLPEGTRVRFGMHYTPNGQATEDRTSLGLVLAEGDAAYLAETMYMHATDVDIPPGAKATFTTETAIPYDVLLHSLTPHMHLRGRTFTAEAIFPDGTEWLLLRIPVWDQDWQNSYVFAEELVVPAGTRLRMTGEYDNTAANPDNPDPSQHVRLGQQIWEEMLTMAVEWIRPREEVLARAARSNPRPALEAPQGGSRAP